VLHSPESEKFLSQHDEWKNVLQKQGVDVSIFAPFTVDLSKGETALKLVTRHIERALTSIDRREDLYVDFTNGTSQYKNILSNIAYVLGIKRQFILDRSVIASSVRTFTNDSGRFFTEDEIRSAYVELPDPVLLDSIAPTWLTEVRRFSIAAKDAAETLKTICGPGLVDLQTFEADITNAVTSWFVGEKRADASALGSAVRHVGRAFEDLIRGVYSIVAGGTVTGSKTVNAMLLEVSALLSVVAADYEPQLLREIADFLQQLRNKSTHEPASRDFGRIRARISTELLLATVQYFKILNAEGLLHRQLTPAVQTNQKYALGGRPGETYYFGLDGDDTGRELERLFQIEGKPEAIAKFSKAVDSAISAVSKRVVEDPINGKIIFSSGDDLLFEGIYVPKAIEDLRLAYREKSRGCTCSIGFGTTLKETYVALKMAKASPGKDCVVGIELVRKP